MSSPYHHESNGLSESMVKVAKKLIHRSILVNEDRYVALLEVRNTPGSLGSSPAQICLGGRTNSMLPAQPKLLRADSKIISQARKSKVEQKLKLQHSSDPRRKLQPLKSGDYVRIQPTEGKSKFWLEAIVVRPVNERSYIVKTKEGKYFRRNRQLL